MTSPTMTSLRQAQEAARRAAQAYVTAPPGEATTRARRAKARAFGRLSRIEDEVFARHARRVLDLSTSHVPMSAADALDQAERVMRGPFGYLLAVHEGAAESWEDDDQPEVGAVLRCALAHGFDFVLLDTDAPVFEGLPTFDS